MNKTDLIQALEKLVVSATVEGLRDYEIIDALDNVLRAVRRNRDRKEKHQ